MRNLGWVCTAFALGLACQGHGYFVCAADPDCGDGVCEPVGACSFSDPACPSGRRYGEASTPSVAGDCVEEVVGSSGSTSDPTTTSGPGGGESSTSSAGGTGPEPVETTGASCPAGWWDCAWAFRHRVVVKNLPATPLVSVPVLVLLGSARVDHERMQADGEDLRFVSSSGTPLPFEVERWDPSALSVVWVQLDEVGSAADSFWVYYGNPVAENAEDASQVWAPSHVGVWHLGDETRDATAEANVAIPTGDVEIAQGQIDSGRDFRNNTSHLDVAAAPSLADLFVGGGTVSAWIRPRGWGQSGFGRIAHKEGGGAGWLLYLGDDGRVRFAQTFESGTVTWTTPIEAVSLHTWTHVAVAFDASATALPRIYVDGVEIALEEPAESPARMVPTDADVPLTFGNRPANDRRFYGILDEIRIERTARSAPWIELQHAAMRDELLEYGPLETREGAP